jgi:hypothetical protein
MDKLIYLSVLVGLAALVVGLSALFFPEKSSAGFGVKTAHPDALVYVRATGARDVFIGLIFLFLFWRKDFGALSIVSFCTAFVSFSDFWITRLPGEKKKSLFHLIATVAAVGYGALLRLNL